MTWRRCGAGIVGAWCSLAATSLAAQTGECYDVTLGEWAAIDSTHTIDWPRPGPPDATGDSLIYAVPVRVRLDSVAHPHMLGRGQFVMTVPAEALQVPHSILTWRAEGDSLALVVSTGFAGTVTRLVRDGSGWLGSARTFSDVAGLLQFDRTVRLHRVVCDLPPTVPASAARPLLGSIDLASGKRLSLGAPLPAGVTTHRRPSGAMTVEDAVSERWMGTDTVVVRVDPDGRLTWIELRYKESFDLTPTLAFLQTEYGPGRQLGDARAWFWNNRTTRMSVRLDHRPSLTLADPRRD